MKTLFIYIVTIFLALSANAQSNFETKENKIYQDGKLFTGIYKVEKDNMLISEFSIENGEEQGAVTHYYSNGKVKEKGSYSNGKKDDKWEKWDEKGNKIGEAYFFNGIKTGTWKVWDHTGTLRNEMNYTDGNRSGIWKMWSDSGELLQEKQY